MRFWGWDYALRQPGNHLFMALHGTRREWLATSG